MMSIAGDCQLTLNVPPALEDTIVDWLLERGLQQGFTSYRADGHGSGQEQLTVNEQVRGRQRRVEFRLVLGLALASELVAQLESDFPGADIFHFMLPVLSAGHLGRHPRTPGLSPNADAGRNRNGLTKD